MQGAFIDDPRIAFKGRAHTDVALGVICGVQRQVQVVFEGDIFTVAQRQGKVVALERSLP